MQHKLTLNSIQNLTKILPILKVQTFSDELVLIVKPEFLPDVLFFLKKTLPT